MPYTFLLVTSLTILLAVLLSLYRVVAGPSIIDRIIGVNVVGTTLQAHLVGLRLGVDPTALPVQ